MGVDPDPAFQKVLIWIQILRFGMLQKIKLNGKKESLKRFFFHYFFSQKVQCLHLDSDPETEMNTDPYWHRICISILQPSGKHFLYPETFLFFSFFKPAATRCLYERTVSWLCSCPTVPRPAKRTSSPGREGEQDRWTLSSPPNRNETNPWDSLSYPTRMQFYRMKPP